MPPKKQPPGKAVSEKQKRVKKGNADAPAAVTKKRKVKGGASGAVPGAGPGGARAALTPGPAPDDLLEKLRHWKGFVTRPNGCKEQEQLLLFGEDSVPPAAEAALVAAACAVIDGQEGWSGAGGGRLFLLAAGPAPPGLEDADTDVLAAAKVGLRIRWPARDCWNAGVDACHQVLFPRTAEDMETEGDRHLLPELAKALADAGCPVWPQWTPAAAALPHLTREHPYLAGRLLFVQPNAGHMDHALHDGGCPVDCPKDASVFSQVSVPPRTMDPGDISESPCFALFRGPSGGSLYAVVQWDYRD